MINAQFEQVLNELHDHSLEIEASALMSIDGIMIASHLPTHVSEDRMAAMSAAMLSLGDRMIADLSGTETDRVMIQSNVGYVIVTMVNEELLLTVVVRPDAKLGMIFHDIKNTAKTINTIDAVV